MSDIILGAHSIYHALINPSRTNKKIYATEKSWAEFKKQYKAPENCEVQRVSSSNFSNIALQVFKDNGVELRKIPSQVFLVCGPLEQKGNAWLYSFVENNEKVKLLALDQVTDVQNAAAILRTAAFYKIDALILSSKNSLSFSPGFFRVASGAYEYVPVVQTANLSKTLKKLQEKNIVVAGLSEEVSSEELPESTRLCLALGSEDKGLSHAVERSLSHHVAFKTDSPICSLNVSVAAALGMERFLNF
ncbi:MAG: RNA methyltransferase [Halobacteriovoraceae bacterium]|nr:RNA methyltransferase [Halobacteriovoraceae bacterium]